MNPIHKRHSVYEIFKDTATGKFRFRLKAKNGQVIAVGELCKTKATVRKQIEVMRKIAAPAEVVEI